MSAPDEETERKQKAAAERLLTYPELYARISALEAELFSGSEKNRLLGSRCAELQAELVEWRNGERQYPPAVQDHKDLNKLCQEATFDLREAKTENAELRTVLHGRWLDCEDEVNELRAKLRDITGAYESAMNDAAEAQKELADITENYVVCEKEPVGYLIDGDRCELFRPRQEPKELKDVPPNE